MSDDTIGPLLRNLRQRAHRSQGEQADHLSDLAGRAVTRNEISRWETERRVLTPWWQEHFADSFGVPVELLRRAVATTKAQRRSEQTPQQEVDPVQRRQFMGAIAGLAVSSSVTTAGRRIGGPEVAQLYHHTARLRRLDNILGGADTYTTYSTHAAELAALTGQASYTGDTGRQLKTLLDEHHQMAGWAAFDAGWNKQAHEHYMTSLSAAKEAGNPALAGNALAFVAYQQTASSRDGTEAADASHKAARQAATPRVRALLLERKAFSHAVVGNAEHTDYALAQAREALAQRDERPEPDWVFWVNDQEIEIMAGRCWTELRRPLRAVRVLESVLAQFDDTQSRDKSLYLTWLASSYLQAGEVEQAAETLIRAHTLSSGVASVRPASRIANVGHQLQQYRTHPAVATALEQLNQ